MSLKHPNTATLSAKRTCKVFFDWRTRSWSRVSWKRSRPRTRIRPASRARSPATVSRWVVWGKGRSRSTVRASKVFGRRGRVSRAPSRIRRRRRSFVGERRSRPQRSRTPAARTRRQRSQSSATNNEECYAINGPVSSKLCLTWWTKTARWMISRQTRIQIAMLLRNNVYLTEKFVAFSPVVKKVVSYLFGKRTAIFVISFWVWQFLWQNNRVLSPRAWKGGGGQRFGCLFCRSGEVHDTPSDQNALKVEFKISMHLQRPTVMTTVNYWKSFWWETVWVCKRQGQFRTQNPSSFWKILWGAPPPDPSLFFFFTSKKDGACRWKVCTTQVTNCCPVPGNCSTLFLQESRTKCHQTCRTVTTVVSFTTVTTIAPTTLGEWAWQFSDRILSSARANG